MPGKKIRPILKFPVSTYCEVEYMEDELKPNTFWLRVGPPGTTIGYRIPANNARDLAAWIEANFALATMPTP